jgi:YfiH family protein
MPFVFKNVGDVGFYEVSGWEGARGIFTTRKGGVSRAPFDSLNLGSGSGDSPGDVHRNRELLADALGLPAGAIKTVHQVHGSDVHVLRDADETRPDEGYDAIVTDIRGAAVGVLTADCVPVLLYDPRARAVAAVHAGWSGTVKAIAGMAVQEMSASYGTRPQDVLASIGPSIGPCCYEVDEKVVGPLRESLVGWWPDLVAPTKDGRWLFDLWKANRLMLVLAGVKPENISVFSACTACNQDKFYSHRKSGGRAGRMMAIAILK